MMEKYRDFCRESMCVQYNFMERLAKGKNPDKETKKQLKLIKARCQQYCEKTAHEFYEWLEKQKAYDDPFWKDTPTKHRPF